VIFATELGRIIFTVLATEAFRGAMMKSGDAGLHHTDHNSPSPEVSGLPNHKQLIERIGDIMGGYELVGDDDFGSIGADLIGDDADLLEALAVSGMSDELISGAGDTEIVGGAKQRKLKELRRLIQRNAGAVVNRGLDRRRRYPLGFIPTSVPAGTSTAVPSAPQNLFRPERLVIPSDIAFDLGVRDIKVGNQSQLVQSAEVPAALFSEVAINTGVTFDTAEVGNQVSVDMRNKSANAVEFSAGLVGTIAK
jgi:hypothetical protein